MNKTTTISLGKLFFHIDEEAYRLLSEYLRNINQYLSNEESREEIIADIEARIAELFTQHMKSDREVISVNDVNDVIDIMGQPEDYQVEDDEIPNQQPKSSTTSTKRLFRDPDNYYLGGVCGGLAHYLSMQTVWVRLIWVLLALFTQGFFLLLYIIFWIATPRAKTTADKLSMKGEPVNFDNIERKVKEDFKYAKEKVGDFAKEHEPTARKVAQETGNVLKKLLTILLKIVGVIMIIVSSLSIVGISIFFLSFGSLTSFDVFDSFSNDVFPFAAPKLVQLILYCLLSLIPMIILFQLGRFFLNPMKYKFSKSLLIANIILFFLAASIMTFLGIQLGMKDSHKGELVFSETISLAATDTLVIQPLFNYKYFDESDNLKNTKLVLDNDEKISASNHVDVSIRTSKTNETKLVWSKIARGQNAEKATDIARQIIFEPEVNEREFKFPTYFTLPQEFVKNKSSVEVKLYLAEGAQFQLTEALYSSLNYSTKRKLSKYKNEYIRVDNNQFECTSCPVEEEVLNEE